MTEDFKIAENFYSSKRFLVGAIHIYGDAII